MGVPAHPRETACTYRQSDGDDANAVAQRFRRYSVCFTWHRESADDKADGCMKEITKAHYDYIGNGARKARCVQAQGLRNIKRFFRDVGPTLFRKTGPLDKNWHPRSASDM